MIDRRNKNAEWNTITESNTYKDEQHYRRASLATLMDIRDELRDINVHARVIANTLNCHNALAIPDLLRQIKKNTTKPKRKRKA